MLNHYSITARPNEANQSRPYIFGLEEVKCLVVGVPGSYSVINAQDHFIHATNANEPIEAVKKYLDWCFGKLPFYAYNAEEEEWEETKETDWASGSYTYHLNRPEWELVEEW